LPTAQTSPPLATRESLSMPRTVPSWLKFDCQCAVETKIFDETVCEPNQDGPPGIKIRHRAPVCAGDRGRSGEHANEERVVTDGRAKPMIATAGRPMSPQAAVEDNPTTEHLLTPVSQIWVRVKPTSLASHAAHGTGHPQEVPSPCQPLVSEVSIFSRARIVNRLTPSHSVRLTRFR